MRIQSILFLFLAIILIVDVAEAKKKKKKKLKASAAANRALALAPPIRRDATGSKTDCDNTGNCTPATDTCQASDCKCYDGTKITVGTAWDPTKGKCTPAAAPGGSTTTAAPKKCKNKHAPGRKSDCPSVKYLCNNSIYYDLMTQQCPKTCKRGKCKDA